MWTNAIYKETKDVQVAFQALDNSEPIPIGYKFVRYHMLFDVKKEDFRRKSRLVAVGHMTEQPDVITYARVVSRETVRLAQTIAALNDLEVHCGDVLNAYITKPVEEKVWTTLGPESGADS